MLGEAQWDWLENELKNDADVNVLVSSIQLLTSFPAIESWGHYPVSKKRLLETIKKSNPKGFLIVSGDVHFGEILGDLDGVVEFTTSGLTHSIMTTLLQGLLVSNVFIPIYNQNEIQNSGPAFYRGMNYGIIELNFGEAMKMTDKNGNVNWGRDVKISGKLKSLKGDAKLSFEQFFKFDEDPSERFQKFENLFPVISDGNRLVRILFVIFSALSGLWVCKKIIEMWIYRMKISIRKIMKGKSRRVD
eukprot:Trichotokara_eunicae@DN7800_c0_g1_i2.p1